MPSGWEKNRDSDRYLSKKRSLSLFFLDSTRQALLIGIIWLALTVAFEFVFGRLVMRRPWSQLLSDYNVFKGRMWAVFLIWLTLAPYVFFRFHCA